MSRKIEFIGEIFKDNLNIESDEDITLIVDGKCILSGKINAKDNSVKVWVNGKNEIRFSGVCKKIVIRNVFGKSIVDFGELATKEASVDRADGENTLFLSVSDKIRKVNLSGETLLYLHNHPRIDNLSLLGKSRIEHFIKTE